MAWIQPNSTIKLFTGLPISNTYQDCLYFRNREECDSYFNRVATNFVFDNNSYVRYNGNKIKLNICADDIYHCNYLCFRNTAFGNKWFYGFITDCEYVNNNCCIITYEIDAITTYLWDCTIGVSHIARQHSVTDGIGDNIVDEPFNFNGYKVNQTYQKLMLQNDMFLVLLMDADTSYGRWIDNNFIRGHLYYCTYTQARLLITEHQEEIACVAPIYSGFVNATPSSLPREPIDLSTETSLVDYHINQNIVAQQPQVGDALDGYIPKNNKLYTAPYNMLRNATTQGDVIDYRYEFFIDGTVAPVFTISCNFLPPLQYACRPNNYTNTNEAFNNYDKTTYINNIPSGQFSIDQYKYWQTAYGESNQLKMGTGAITGMATAMTAAAKFGSAFGPTGMAISVAAAGVAGTIAGMYPSSLERIDAKNAPDNWSLSNTSSTALFANKDCGFALQNVCLNASELAIIDDYFTRYGYAQNRLAIPNLRARDKWTYIKCDLTITNTNMPTNAFNIIKKVFDSGTTFWSSPAYVGHYELSNSTL